MDKNYEQLSSLMDGELEPKGAEFLLRRVADDPGLSAAWHRLHTLRSGLHGECAGRLDLVGRVHRAIESEAAPEVDRRAAGSWLRYAAGGAVAASVALVAIVGINNNLLDLAPGAADAEADSQGFVSQATALDRQFSRQAVPVSFSPQGERPGTASADARQRISSYVVRHNQVAGGTGFIPYAPILTASPEIQATVSSAGEQGHPDEVAEPDSARTPEAP